ncbi:MAG: sugar ABC transporter permease [Anaerolineae bacterium]|nr:sugar ABC transporter permease [Anaerolineae bacterium]
MTAVHDTALRPGPGPNVDPNPSTQASFERPTAVKGIALIVPGAVIGLLIGLASYFGILGGKSGFLGGRNGPLYNFEGMIGALILGSLTFLLGILVSTIVLRLTTKGREQRYWRDTLIAYLLVSPAVTIMTIFTFVAIIYALYVSMHRFGLGEVARRKTPEFIGLGHYIEAMVTPGSRRAEFWMSLATTLWLTIGSIPLQIAFALGIAVLLFRKIRGVDFYRTSFFLPYVTATIALAQVWVVLFSRADVGLINYLLEVVGIPRQGWLMEARSIFDILTGGLISWGPSQALVVIMLYSVWKYFGFSTVILLAGLSNIDPTLYEAAQIDGANAWQSFRRITIPLLSPTLYYVILISSIGSLRSFDTVYQLSIRASAGSGPGGPLDSTQTLVIYVFNQFWRDHYFGYGSALALILFVIILIITLIQQRIASKQVFYG